MSQQYKAVGYNITTDPNFQNEKFGNTPELVSQLEKLYIEAQDKKNKKIITKLTELVIKHPKSPQLKNYLSAAYSVRGNIKKALEVNNWILAEHPDYLFAKLNLANQFIYNQQPEKVLEILGEALEIKELYPERDLFHLAEVTGFYRTAIHYYTAIKNLELAENRFDVLQNIAPDHPDTEIALSYLEQLRLEKGMERWKEENEAQIKVKPVNPVASSKQQDPPVFHHPEINQLYQYGLNIPHEILREILALPLETVVSDLEKVLSDAISRYQYFSGQDGGGDLDLDEETHSFPLHAICLLGELRAEKSLPAILSFLENNEEVLEYWMGDHITSTIWLPIYLLAPNNLDVLEQFLKKPGIGTYSKIVVSEALCQLVLHRPEYRNDILSVYSRVLSYFSQSNLEDNIIDSDFLGLCIGDAMDCQFTELLPVIKNLYEKDYVSQGVNGTYQDVEKELKSPFSRDHKRKIYSICDLYEHITSTWAGYTEDANDDENYTDYQIQQPAVSVKISRNDPCPCGSGKKYKKCCIDKMP